MKKKEQRSTNPLETYFLGYSEHHKSYSNPEEIKEQSVCVCLCVSETERENPLIFN